MNEKLELTNRGLRVSHRKERKGRTNELQQFTCTKVLYTHLPYHNDSIIVKTHEERKQEDFFNNIFISLFYCKGLKGLFKVCM